MRLLNSDQLGKMAQSQFETDCIPGGLIPNEAGFDRTGWDYIVEWPQDTISTPLDARPTPISCHVQIKAAWRGNDTIRLRLSSAERLAKEPKPTFIYVFAIDDDLKYLHAHVIHVGGDFLALVLKKLRESEAAAQRANMVHFDVTVPKWGTRIDVGGPAFRKFVESAVGGSMAEYIATKQLELKTLGYGPGRFKLTTSFFGTPEDIADAFLGLKRIEGEVEDHFEERFGIPLPLPEFDIGKGIIEFQPDPSCKCEVRFRKSRNSPMYSFKGHLYRGPAVLINPPRMKIAIKTDLLSLTFTANKNAKAGSNLDFSASIRQDIIEKERFKSADWKCFYEFAASLDEGPLMIELASREPEMPVIRGTINPNGDRETDSHRCRRITSLIQQLDKVLHVAGRRNLKFGIRELLEASKDIEVAAALIEKPNSLTSLSFKTDPVEGLTPGLSTPMLYFRSFELGGYEFAFCAKLTAAVSSIDAKANWGGSEMEFISLERLGLASGSKGEVSRSLRSFLDLMHKETGIDSHFLATDPPIDRPEA